MGYLSPQGLCSKYRLVAWLLREGKLGGWGLGGGVSLGCRWGVGKRGSDAVEVGKEDAMVLCPDTEAVWWKRVGCRWRRCERRTRVMGRRGRKQQGWGLDWTCHFILVVGFPLHSFNGSGIPAGLRRRVGIGCGGCVG